MIKIVVDAMGGDNGSKSIVKAIRDFHSDNNDVEITVCGNKEELSSLEDICNIIESKSVVPMEAGPLEVMRMKDSSMCMAINYMKENKCDAVVSCGSTGGFLSAATLNLKLIQGVKRAALVSPFPTKVKGKKVVILDIGANNENSPEELVQFALMGRLYSKVVLGVESPKTYLLSNGTEEGKGTPAIKQAHKLLKESKFEGFMGNIEARDSLSGEADVIVCDGFSGNVLLKSTEGTAKMMSSMIKNIFKKNIFTIIGYLHVRKGVKDMSETMDYKSTGGAMLLGVNGVVVKAHGNSDDYAFYHALKVAKKLSINNISKKIEEGLKND